MASAMFARREIRRLNLTEIAGGFPDDPAICGICDFWQSMCRDSRLPARNDMSPSALRPWIGNVSLVDVVQTPQSTRFRWRLVGSHIVERLGRDATGLWFDELYEDPVLQDYVDRYMAATQRRAPVFYRGDLEFVGKEFLDFNSVHLPLAERPGDPINMLLLCLQFD